MDHLELFRHGVISVASVWMTKVLPTTRYSGGPALGIFPEGYYMNEYRAQFSELFKGFSQKIGVKHFTFDPTYNFGYFDNPTDLTSIHDIQSTEAYIESRYARDEIFLQDDNDRISRNNQVACYYCTIYSRCERYFGQ